MVNKLLLASNQSLDATIEGKSFKWNQLVQNGNFTDVSVWSLSYCSYSVNSNTATIVPNAIHGSFRQTITITNNHKIFYCFDIKYTLGETYISNFFNIQTVRTGTGNWEHIETIITPTNTNGFINIYDYDNDIRSTWYLKNVMVIDLTDLFGAGNEPTTLSDFYLTDIGKFIKAGNYLPYGSGIQSANEPLRFESRNIFNGILEQGQLYTNGSTGASNNDIRTRDFIKVKPNTTYYFSKFFETASNTFDLCEYDENYTGIVDGTYVRKTKYNNTTFTTLSNTQYIKFSFYKSGGITPENKNVLLQLSSYTDTSYVPYLNLSYTRSGRVDLGSLNWTIYGSGLTERAITTDLTSLIKKPQTLNDVGNIHSSIGKAISYNTLYSGNVGIALDTNGNFFVKSAELSGMTAEQVKQALNGVYLEYETAQPLELRSVGTVKDTLWNCSGKVERKLGSYTFTGNELWQVITTGGGKYRFFTTKDDMVDGTQYGIPNILCADYKTIDNNTSYFSSDIDLIGNTITTDAAKRVLIVLKDQTISDVNSFKNIIVGKTIIYELATPTIETHGTIAIPKIADKCYDSKGNELTIIRNN